MGIIPKVRNTIRGKKRKENVQKCHVNSLARMESACVLREDLIERDVCDVWLRDELKE